MTNKEAIAFFEGLLPGNAISEEATRLAIEALKKPEIKWIPTSERLPEKSGQYLVMGKGKYWISELMILQPIGVKGWCSACGNPQIEAWAFIGRTPEEHETH